MKLWKRIVAGLLIFAIAFCGVVWNASPAPTAFAASYAELIQQRLDLQTELINLNKEIKNIKNQTARLQAELASLDTKIEIVSAQVALYEQSIALVAEELAAKQAEFDAKVLDIEKSYDLFGQRMRAMYMSNNMTTLSTLLAANSFSEFLVAAEAMRRISQHDTDLINKLTLEKQEIETAKTEIEDTMAVLETEKAEQDAKFDELAELYQQADSALSQQAALQAAKNDQYASIQDDFAALDEEIAELSAASNGQFIGGVFRWPLPGYSYISSKYGNRVHPITGVVNSFHSGIDITGYLVYGKSVIAANSGRVSTVRYGSTGYGYYVMIDHGGGVYTLYAHLSSISVKVGQIVTQGETIAQVGSTGASTGPHLHFEVRISGQSVNPQDYVNSSW